MVWTVDTLWQAADAIGFSVSERRALADAIGRAALGEPLTAAERALIERRQQQDMLLADASAPSAIASPSIRTAPRDLTDAALAETLWSEYKCARVVDRAVAALAAERGTLPADRSERREDLLTHLRKIHRRRLNILEHEYLRRNPDASIPALTPDERPVTPDLAAAVLAADEAAMQRVADAADAADVLLFLATRRSDALGAVIDEGPDPSVADLVSHLQLCRRVVMLRHQAAGLRSAHEELVARRVRLDDSTRPTLSHPVEAARARLERARDQYRRRLPQS